MIGIVEMVLRVKFISKNQTKLESKEQEVAEDLNWRGRSRKSYRVTKLETMENEEWIW